MLRGLSYRELSNYCDVSHTMISEIEKGNRGLTKETHDEIVKGINLAYDAKLKGTLKAENTRKTETAVDAETETESEAEPKKETLTKKTTKIRKTTKTEK